LTARQIALSFLALLATIAVAAAWAWQVYTRPLQMKDERVRVLVPPGSSARAAAQRLRTAGIAVNELVFVASARLTGASQSLRAGRYEFERGMSIRELIEWMRLGKTLKDRFTLIEGWTVRDLRAALAAIADLRQDSAAMGEADLLQAVGAAEQRAEGLFAPDTYLFDAGSSDLDLLRQAYRAQQSVLRGAWEGRAPDLPYRTPYEALIMASIVEKETGQATDRAQIAGVFANRLRRGMMLQTDPTVIYGLGEAFDGNLRKRDLLADGPYNTYTRAGLPPTPIALPGRAAIEAVLHPAATPNLYFVARGDGSSEFSTTLGQHNRAVSKYQLKRGN
jgi:UPF0755 protein